MNKLTATFIFAASHLVTAFSVAAEGDSIRGAGSTFAAAAYTSWAFVYTKEKNTPVTYQPSGSGDGIRQIMAKSVDFAASDYPLPQDELKKNDLLQFPTLISAIVPVVNLPGIKPGQLRLNGALLAGLFSGQITMWNDREIQALNPDLTLPKIPVARIVRSDQSGTTAGFTEYLSKVDGDWARRIGSGLVVNWPKGIEALKGNDGVSGAIKAREGAIGYVSANQVASAKLAYVLLQNRQKAFVAPTEEAMLAAVKSSSTQRGEERISFLDASAPGAWPITDATYILIERTPKSPKQYSRVLQFFYWAFLRGDSMASETGYIPLPPSVQARAVGILGQVRDAQGNPLNFMTRTRDGSLSLASLLQARAAGG